MESKYLNFLLNENEINRIANEVGLCKRIRKFTPMELLKMVTFSPNNIAKDILNEISLNLFEESDILVSSESLNKRFNSTFVKFLKAIFLELLNIQFNIKKHEKNIMKGFNRILLTDSTVSKLHSSLSEEYPGGRNQEGPYSSLKINLIKDLKNNTPVDVQVSRGTKNDYEFLPRIKKFMKSKDLILNDLGYCSLEFLKNVIKKKAFFVSKLKLNSLKTIFLENPTPEYFKNGTIKVQNRFIPFDVEKECNSMIAGEIREFENVHIGSDSHKLPCRLIITKLDGALEERRYKTITKKIRMCRGIKEENRKMAKFGFMITNLSKDLYPKEQIYPIYSLRWQIELEFKNWKSILEIDESGRKLKKERIEAHFYGKLINILVNNEVSKTLKDEIEIKNIILSDKKVFHHVSYYLEKLHHYNYKLGVIFDKLKKLIPKTCLKSKRKGNISSNEIMKFIT
jgi:Transposase DDE domain.